MVEGHRDAGERSARRHLNFTFDINMAGPLRRRDEEGASPRNRPQKCERDYITEEQVRHLRINGLSLCIYSRNMNTSIGNAASMNQKTKNMNTVLGRV
jgi:hypothetical protein